MTDDETCPGLAFKHGNRAAFDLVVEKYRERLYRIAYRILRDHDEAWDVSQETLIRAYQKIDAWDGGARFYTWLYRIATNLAIDRHRRKGRESRAYEAYDPQVSTEPTAFERLVKQEQLQHMERAVATLPPGQRAVLVLRHYEGLSLQEIADVRGRALGTIKSTLFQAFRNLKKAMQLDSAKEVK